METVAVKDNKDVLVLSAVVAKVVIIPCVFVSIPELECFVDSVVVLLSFPFTSTSCRTKAIPTSKWTHKILCG